MDFGRAQKKKFATCLPKRGVKKALMRWYARYPIIMGTVVGIRELERHECGASVKNTKISATDQKNRDFFAAGAPKRRVRAAPAPEPL